MTTGEAAYAIRFILAVLAAWRVAHLLVREDGPGGCIARLRAVFGRSLVGEMMDCFGCTSLWVAAPFGVFVGGPPVDMIVGWLAVSGGAYLLDLWTPQPIILTRHEPQPREEPDDGML